MSRKLNIAFCINRLALIGLGPTVSSLIRNCSNPSQISIWFMCAGLTQSDKQSIIQLVREEDFTVEYHLIDFDPEAHFRTFSALHGDWTAYGRLLLADLLPIDSVLYLDSDLIIELDLLELLNVDLADCGLAAVPGTKLRYALDNTFLNGRLNISLETEYFNSGVVLMNLAFWRKHNIKQQLLAIAQQYPNELTSHDQTLLNAVFYANYHKLDAKFNCPWYAHRARPNVADKMILHFLGSPKPWDFATRFFHGGYSTWNKYLTKNWADSYDGVSLKQLSRAWKIRRSYAKLIRKKLKK